MRYKSFNTVPFCLPFGKADDTPLLRYQGLAVDDYGFVLDALDMGHPKLLLNYGFITPLPRIIRRNLIDYTDR